jgi:hypothetical protein
MPFLALVSAFSITTFLKEKNFQKFNPFLITVVVLLTIIFPIRRMFSMSPQDLSLWVYGRYDQFYEAELVGKKLAEVTKKDDYVYVEGMDPEITYFAKRLSSVRFEWTNFLTSDCGSLKKFKDYFIKDLEEHPPAAITLCVSGSCGVLWKDPVASQHMKYLEELTRKNYRSVGGWVVNTTGGYWLDSPDIENINDARTVLFVRK